MNIYGIVMAGGGGTRFWPLSRTKTPKQLLNLSGKDVMVNEAIARLCRVTLPENIYIATNESQRDPMEEAVGGRIPAKNILAEPAARNTAACIGYAAVELLKTRGDGIMVITPSDAYIRDEETFAKTLRIAIRAAEETGKLVTIGITPTFPATGYGYIRFREAEEPVKEVVRFVEKPPLEQAEEYLRSGDYVWNSGMFVWKISTILEHYQRLLPELFARFSEFEEAIGTDREAELLRETYAKISPVSVDCGIMERSSDILVVPGEFGWSDVGSWDMLSAVRQENEEGNIVVGDGVLVDVKNSTVYAESRTVALVGVEGLVVVETPDAVLVLPKERAQDVKKLVDELKKRGKEELL